MSKGNLEQRIERLRALADQPVTEDALAILRKALTDRSGLIVAEAAKAVGVHRVHSLTPDLTTAFERMLQKGATTDPKCWGKKAIVDALKDMDHEESYTFLHGLRHVQMEPVWGGQEDSATSLRGACALALLQCADLSRETKFRHLVDAMGDPVDRVRVDVLRGIAQMEGDDGALLLRMKARSGDPMPHVIGHALELVIGLEGAFGVTFVTDFLASGDEEILEEAALALGTSRRPEAFAVLQRAWAKDHIGLRAEVLLRAISASGLPEAIDFLMNLIEEGITYEADAAVKALGLYSGSGEIQERIRQARERRSVR